MIPREVGQTMNGPLAVASVKPIVKTTPFIQGSPVSTLIPFKTTTVKPALSGSVTIVNKATGLTTTGIAVPSSPKLTTAQQDAINQASQLKQTAWINANPTVQKNLALLRSAKTIADLKKAGNVIVPQSVLDTLGLSLPSDMAQIQALTTTNKELQTALSDYYNRLSGSMSELQRGTVAYGSLLESQQHLQGQYENLLAKYQDLLNNPPSQGLDIFSWISKNWIYLVLGGGGLVLLYAIIRGRR